MKIKLKLTADELRYIDDKTTLVFSLKPGQLPTEKRFFLSIMVDIADKIIGKSKTLNRQLSITDGKKKYEASFKYHEAYALRDYVSGYSDTETDPYKQNLARKIISQLDQKLA